MSATIRSQAAMSVTIGVFATYLAVGLCSGNIAFSSPLHSKLLWRHAAPREPMRRVSTSSTLVPPCGIVTGRSPAVRALWGYSLIGAAIGLLVAAVTRGPVAQNQRRTLHNSGDSHASAQLVAEQRFILTHDVETTKLGTEIKNLMSSLRNVWPRLFGTGVVLLLVVVSAVVSFAPPVFANAEGKWTYNEMGADWGKEYPECNGDAQTPIGIEDRDINLRGAESLFRLLRYKPTNTELFNNNGKNVQANGNFGTFSLPDGMYDVKQFHFHFPAEHKIQGRLPAGELHIVHQRRGSQGAADLAVVGIFLEEGGDVVYGEEAAFMAQLGFGTGLPKPGSPKEVYGLDLEAFQQEFKQGFWHYKGSLTTPPCSETVHWYVLKKRVYLTQGMVDTFKQGYPANNRRLMPVNGRSVTDSDISIPGEYQQIRNSEGVNFRGEKEEKPDFLD